MPTNLNGVLPVKSGIRRAHLSNVLAFQRNLVILWSNVLMTNKQRAQLKKAYIDMVTSPQFCFPPALKWEAEVDWMIFEIAIDEVFPNA